MYSFSSSPGSGVVTYYLEESGVIPYLETLGFGVVGYCIIVQIQLERVVYAGDILTATGMDA